jgi:hypothetical protein
VGILWNPVLPAPPPAPPAPPNFSLPDAPDSDSDSDF